jgi:archaemetzincin
MRKILFCASVPFLATAFWVFATENAAGRQDDPDPQQLKEIAAKLIPLHKKMGKPEPGDWLLSHKEPGQTFDEYLKANPIRPTGNRNVNHFKPLEDLLPKQRNVIYVQPLGEFSPKQRKIIELTADFIGRYFGTPTKIKSDLSLTIIPEKARRIHPTLNVRQILSTYILDEILTPRLPEDAAAYIAFTASDLWPGKGWNFVFGQASLRGRVGVWSIHRYGDCERSDEDFRLCLLRTMKVGTHETGHMFTMKHCILYECNMCGSNHIGEMDRRPVLLCPECVPKVWHAARMDPIKRYQSLYEFCRDHGLESESEAYKAAIVALGGELPKNPENK